MGTDRFSWKFSTARLDLGVSFIKSFIKSPCRHQWHLSCHRPGSAGSGTGDRREQILGKGGGKGAGLPRRWQQLPTVPGGGCCHQDRLSTPAHLGRRFLSQISISAFPSHPQRQEQAGSSSALLDTEVSRTWAVFPGHICPSTPEQQEGACQPGWIPRIPSVLRVSSSPPHGICGFPISAVIHVPGNYFCRALRCPEHRRVGSEHLLSYSGGVLRSDGVAVRDRNFFRHSFYLV